MTDVMYFAFIDELQKIAAEGSANSAEATNPDVDSDQQQTAAHKLFALRELTRIKQGVTENGKPDFKASGSPVMDEETALKEAETAGRVRGIKETGTQLFEELAKASKRSYDLGYGNAAKEGVSELAKASKRSYDLGYENATKVAFEIVSQLSFK